MALTDDQVKEVWADFVGRTVTVARPCPWDAQALVDAVQTLDIWLGDNQAGYNSQLTSNAATFDADATQSDKDLLLALVASKLAE